MPPNRDHAHVGPWHVSLQVHVWTTVAVDAEDLDEAVSLAEAEARARYGDDVFINRDSTEVA